MAAYGRLRERIEAALLRSWWAPRPTALALALQPLAWVYAGLARLDRALARPQQVGVPVVVVGNLIVGGAGKTPTVVAVVRLLRAFGWTPGVVSRGYGRRARGTVLVKRDSAVSDCGDEPLLLHLRSGAPVAVARARVAAARALRKAHPEVDIVVADDGLQHHRLARDAEVVVFDARGVGNGLRLPAGPLRERLPETTGPQTLVLYNAPAPSTSLPGWLVTRRLAGLVSLAAWWRGEPASREALWPLMERPVLALAGVASPQAFFEMLRREGLSPATQALPDHYDFVRLPWRDDTADVIVTEKDAVKLRPERLSGKATRVWVAPLDFDPELPFIAALKRLFPHPPTRNTPTPWPKSTTA